MNAKSYIKNLALGIFISPNVSKCITYSPNHEQLSFQLKQQINYYTEYLFILK